MSKFVMFSKSSNNNNNNNNTISEPKMCNNSSNKNTNANGSDCVFTYFDVLSKTMASQGYANVKQIYNVRDFQEATAPYFTKVTVQYDEKLHRYCNLVHIYDSSSKSSDQKEDKSQTAAAVAGGAVRRASVVDSGGRSPSSIHSFHNLKACVVYDISTRPNKSLLLMACQLTDHLRANRVLASASNPIFLKLMPLKDNRLAINLGY
jgi:hypothetical protein